MSSSLIIDLGKRVFECTSVQDYSNIIKCLLNIYVYAIDHY